MLNIIIIIIYLSYISFKLEILTYTAELNWFYYYYINCSTIVVTACNFLFWFLGASPLCFLHRLASVYVHICTPI